MVVHQTLDPYCLRDAHDLRGVMDAVLVAVSDIAEAEGPALLPQYTPRCLDSREDVEHWGRRLRWKRGPADAAQALLQGLLSAALARLDEIGPVRRRRDA